MLRPLGKADDEIAGVYLPLETVVSARFGFPDPGQVGDYLSARLLRDAVQLGFRSSADYLAEACEAENYRHPAPSILPDGGFVQYP